MVSRLILSLRKPKSYCKRKIKLLSPAKVNLYLNILGDYPGGFHRIESIVERVSLFDEIEIRVTEDPSIKVVSKIQELKGAHNLCFRAATLIKKEYKVPFGFTIVLKKKIPLGAGLGGGSSNAATTLLGINALLDLNIAREKLFSLGGVLGSDINFFLSDSQYALLSGRGEKVLPFRGKCLSHFVIWPGVNLSTKDVYEKTRVKLTKFLNNVKILKYALEKGDTYLLKKNIFNVLEGSALTLCLKARRMIQNLNSEKIATKISGSGSSFYTLGKGCSLRKLQKFLPKGGCIFPVQTF